jgi:hypothetical protein
VLFKWSGRKWSNLWLAHSRRNSMPYAWHSIIYLTSEYNSPYVLCIAHAL